MFSCLLLIALNSLFVPCTCWISWPTGSEYLWYFFKPITSYPHFLEPHVSSETFTHPPSDTYPKLSSLCFLHGACTYIFPPSGTSTLLLPFCIFSLTDASTFIFNLILERGLALTMLLTCDIFSLVFFSSYIEWETEVPTRLYGLNKEAWGEADVWCGESQSRAPGCVSRKGM